MFFFWFKVLILNFIMVNYLFFYLEFVLWIVNVIEYVVFVEE